MIEMKIKGFLNRLQEKDDETLGELRLFLGLSLLFSGQTLEPAWRGNQPQISCIPAGTYQVMPRRSDLHGHHYIITGADGREYILIHVGNFRRNTKGCCLIGSSFADLNADKVLDLTGSQAAMDRLLQVVGDNGFTLTIAG